MSNKLRPKPSVTAPGLTLRAGQLPDTPAFTPYGSNPTLPAGGGSVAPTFVPSVPAGAPSVPLTNMYPGGTPVMDPDDLAALREAHNHMLYLDPRSAQPLTDGEVAMLQQHAGTGCNLCQSYLAGARRGAAGVKVRIQRQQAAEAAAARKRR